MDVLYTPIGRKYKTYLNYFLDRFFMPEDLYRPPLALAPPAPLAPHDCVDRLADPSLHMNVSPWQ
jgi:hypothetical protein